jgi:hypothetical protein
MQYPIAAPTSARVRALSCNASVAAAARAIRAAVVPAVVAPGLVPAAGVAPEAVLAAVDQAAADIVHIFESTPGAIRARCCLGRFGLLGK